MMKINRDYHSKTIFFLKSLIFRVIIADSIKKRNKVVVCSFVTIIMCIFAPILQK